VRQTWRTHEVSLPLASTIYDLRSAISEISSVPVEKCRLVSITNKNLDKDWLGLEEAGVQSGAVLTLVVSQVPIKRRKRPKEEPWPSSRKGVEVEKGPTLPPSQGLPPAGPSPAATILKTGNVSEVHVDFRTPHFALERKPRAPLVAPTAPPSQGIGGTFTKTVTITPASYTAWRRLDGSLGDIARLPAAVSLSILSMLSVRDKVALARTNRAARAWVYGAREAWEVLDVSHYAAHCTGRALEALVKLVAGPGALRSVVLAGCARLRDEALLRALSWAVAVGCAIEMLDLRGCMGLGPAMVSLGKSLTSLRALRLPSICVPDGDGELSYMPADFLEAVVTSGGLSGFLVELECKAIVDDQLFETLGAHCRHLAVLRLGMDEGDAAGAAGAAEEGYDPASPLTWAAMDALAARCRRLQTLELSSVPRMEGSWLTSLARYGTSPLLELSASGTGDLAKGLVMDKSVGSSGGFPSLRVLMLERAQWSEAAPMAALGAAAPALDTARLVAVKAPAGSALGMLRCWPRLTKLTLVPAPESPGILFPAEHAQGLVAACPELRELEIGCADAQDAHLAVLASLPSLVFITLRGASGLTPRWAEATASSCSPHLVNLTLVDCTFESKGEQGEPGADPEVQPGKIESLRTLVLERCKGDPQLLTMAFPRLPDLRRLWLTECPQITTTLEEGQTVCVGLQGVHRK
jgi:hypothetical protein